MGFLVLWTIIRSSGFLLIWSFGFGLRIQHELVHCFDEVPSKGNRIKNSSIYFQITRHKYRNEKHKNFTEY